MKQLVLHPKTKEAFESLKLSPPHAIILIGPQGIGKQALATNLAESILQIEDISSYPYAITINSEEGKNISIEHIRGLEGFLKLKVLNPGNINRVVIINDAERLGLEAQNALLKTLEEPPKGTIIILNSTSLHKLLPTLRSRAQIVNINRPIKSDILKKYRNFSNDVFNQAYSISGGRPGLLGALLNNEEHPLIEATRVARKILSSSLYERLLLIDELSRSKELALNALTILEQMAEISLSTPGPANAKWQRILMTSYITKEALEKNAQPKLALTNLMLNL